jgi:hypothetical protein
MGMFRACLLLSAALMALDGCAAIRRNEAKYDGALLKAAGFEVAAAADRPDRVEELHAMPPLEMVSRASEAGSLEYRLADPYLCRCLYIGDAHSLRQYEQLLSDDLLRALLASPSL